MSDGKNAVGLKGFPTTNTASEIDSYLLFLFPDEEWAQWILGALEPMAYPDNWYKSGEMSTDESAEAFRLIIEQAPYNLNPANMPAPWWDDESADDSDDEAPTDMQPWYGGIVILDDNLTFVENAFIWAVAGFIAYSGAIGAALSFVPIARRFVVTVKSNPLGGIVRFFADAVQIGEVDTYSPTDMATEVYLEMPEPAMGLLVEDAPTFWAVLADENPHDLESVSISIVRSRLAENDFSPTALRYNEETDAIEYSPDNGETWNPSPGDDPRTSIKFLKPLKTGTDVQCRSAASMVKWLRDFIDYETGVISTGAEVTAIANIALSFFDIIAPYAILIQAIIGVAGSLFGAGAAALELAFDDDTWDALMCIFFCDIGTDGSISDSQFLTIQDDITAKLNTTAALILNLILQTQGVVGLQNAGTLYEVEGADCSGCECGWCKQWDFLTSDGDYDAYFYASVWTGGVGWRQGDSPTHSTSGTAITLMFTPAMVTHAEFTYDADLATTPGNATVFLLRSGEVVERVDTASANGTNTWYWDGGPTEFDQVIFAGQWSGAGDTGGIGTILRAKMRGVDDSPFGANNC